MSKAKHAKHAVRPDRPLTEDCLVVRQCMTYVAGVSVAHGVIRGDGAGMCATCRSSHNDGSCAAVRLSYRFDRSSSQTNLCRCLDRAHLSPDRDYDTCLTNRQACNSACPLTHHSRIPSSPAGSSCERATWLALSAMRRNTSAGARRATIPPALSAHFHSDIREPATACDLWRWCRCGCAYTAMAGC